MKGIERRLRIRVFGTGCCLTLTAAIVMVIAPASTFAKRPPRVEHLFGLLPQPDINGDGFVDGLDHGLLIIGLWLVEEDGSRTFTEDISLWSRWVGGVGDDQLVINRPSAAIQLPMLADFVDEDGDRWDGVNDPHAIYSGSLVMSAGTKMNPEPHAIFFFTALNKRGEEQNYQLVAAASITGDGDPDGTSFPMGLESRGVYTILLTDWVLLQSSRSRKAAYEGPVAGGATIIEIERRE